MPGPGCFGCIGLFFRLKGVRLQHTRPPAHSLADTASALAHPPTRSPTHPPARRHPLLPSYDLEVGPSLLEAVIEEGTSSEYGARPLRRVSQHAF